MNNFAPMLVDHLRDIFTIKEQKIIHENTDYQFVIHQIFFENTNFQLLITEGLSNREQNVNNANQDLKHIELYFCLPDYWNIEQNSWPLHWLNRIAQVPQKNNTWFGNGDTLPAGNPPEKLQADFEANHFIISKPVLLEEQFSTEQWKAPFSPLAIIPIFQTEVEFKLRNSHTILFRKFAKNMVTELVDTYRSSTCRKRILGMF